MTLVSNNVYIDKVDEIVNKYNNACHSTIIMKPVDVNSGIDILMILKNILIKILNLRLVTM